MSEYVQRRQGRHERHNMKEKERLVKLKMGQVINKEKEGRRRKHI